MFHHQLRRPTIATLVLAAMLMPADAAWRTAQPASSEGAGRTDTIRMAQRGGCSAAASQAAAQSGGQVLSVQTAQRGGRTVCIVTVLIPAQDGNRPRRQTITIQQ